MNSLQMYIKKTIRQEREFFNNSDHNFFLFSVDVLDLLSK